MLTSHVQVCFMTDFNKSMHASIGALKDQFCEILDDIQNQYPTCVIEVAFVGYGGISDIPSSVFEQFTTNRKALQRRARDTQISRGYTSDCRMVIEGYVMVANLQWKFSRRIVFHMGDAPSYGEKYHDKNLNDAYSCGHPYWTLESRIENVADKNIDVVILKISKTTTQMEKVLENSYLQVRPRGFYVVDLTGKLNNLNDAVYEAVKSHILRILA